MDVDADVNASALRVADLRAILRAHHVSTPKSARKADLVDAFEQHVRPALQRGTVGPVRADGVKREQQDAAAAAAAKAEPAPSLPAAASVPMTPPAARDMRFSDENPFQSARKKERPARGGSARPSPLKREASAGPGAADHDDTKPSLPTTTPVLAASPASPPRAHAASDTPRAPMPPTTPTPPTPPTPPLAAPATEASAAVRDSATKTAPATPYSAKSRRPPPMATPASAAYTPTTRSPERVQALALEAQAAAAAQYAAARTPPRPPAPVWRQVRAGWRGMLLRWLGWALVVTWLYYCWQTRRLGYCSTARPRYAPPVSVWDRVQPVCTPCPEHGVCVGGALVACASSDYVVAEPWYARVPGLAHALPLSWCAASCVPDTHKLVMAAELADAIVDDLAQWHGDVQCQRVAPEPDAPPHALGPAARREADVRAALAARVADDVGAATFRELWDMATAGLLEYAPDELIAVREGDTRWLLTPRATMPLTCRARLLVAAWARRHQAKMGASALALAAALVAVARARRARHARARAGVYVQNVYDLLQAQAERAAADGAPRGLPVTQVRDAVLATEPSPHVRRQQWALVAQVVERNANVRTRQAQWHGEWQRVWEWVGFVQAPSSPAPGTPRAEARAARPDPDVVSEPRDDMHGDLSAPHHGTRGATLEVPPAPDVPTQAARPQASPTKPVPPSATASDAARSSAPRTAWTAVRDRLRGPHDRARRPEPPAAPAAAREPPRSPERRAGSPVRPSTPLGASRLPRPAPRGAQDGTPRRAPWRW